MEPAFRGLVVDSSIVIDAVAELVHGVERAQTLEIRQRRRAFIDELKKHVPVQPVTDESAELAGTISGGQAAKGIRAQLDDLLIGVANV